jgi:DNA-directed RNA polymerase subunit M/transcription elongation factor TFIIS
MSLPTIWATDDPCPDCGSTLTLTEDGSVLRVECRSCGYADTWATDQAGPDGDRAEARQASKWLLHEYELDAAALQAGLNGRLADEAQQQRFLRFISPGPMFTLKDG